MKEEILLVGKTPKEGPEIPLGTARRLANKGEDKLLLSWLAIGDALAAIAFVKQSQNDFSMWWRNKQSWET